MFGTLLEYLTVVLEYIWAGLAHFWLCHWTVLFKIASTTPFKTTAAWILLVCIVCLLVRQQRQPMWESWIEYLKDMDGGGGWMWYTHTEAIEEVLAQAINISLVII